ncbi:hypothetical protein ACE6H2_016354 [Prunus campanulata]
MRQMLSRSSASHHPLYQQLPNPFHMSYYSPQMFHQMPYQAKSVTPTGGLTGLLKGSSHEDGVYDLENGLEFNDGLDNIDDVDTSYDVEEQNLTHGREMADERERIANLLMSG